MRNATKWTIYAIKSLSPWILLKELNHPPPPPPQQLGTEEYVQTSLFFFHLLFSSLSLENGGYRKQSATTMEVRKVRLAGLPQLGCGCDRLRR